MRDKTYILDGEEGFHNAVEKRKDCINRHKAMGKTPKQARIACRTERGGGIVSRSLKKVGGALPRNAFLGLTKLNYRGLASRMNRAKSGHPDTWKKIQQRWIRFGGNPDSLWNAIITGRNKKPIICGAKCKAKIESLNFSNFTEQDEAELKDWIDSLEYDNAEPVTTTATGAAVASASPIIVAMAGLLGTIALTTKEKQAMQNDLQQSELEAMASAEEQASKDARLKTIVTASAVGLILLSVVGIIILNKKRKKG